MPLGLPLSNWKVSLFADTSRKCARIGAIEGGGVFLCMHGNGGGTII